MQGRGEGWEESPLNGLVTPDFWTGVLGRINVAEEALAVASVGSGDPAEEHGAEAVGYRDSRNMTRF